MGDSAHPFFSGELAILETVVSTAKVKEKKSREKFLKVLSSCVASRHISTDTKVLVVGGNIDDFEILKRTGFRHIILSNFDGRPGTLTGEIRQPHLMYMGLDGEQMGLADDSFDMVFAHEVIHHCRSPHRAVCEMLRVSRKYVLFLEPNDSFLMRTITQMGFSFPYELPGGLVAGGVRNSSVPNYIYRWNSGELRKTVASFLAECEFSFFSYPYWDFNATEEDLELRKQTRLRLVTSSIGVRNFLSALRCMQVVLNRISFIRRQGNKFFCCIEKQDTLKPWLLREQGEIVFNPRYGEADHKKHF